MLAYARMASRSYLDLEEPLRVGELVKLKSGGPVMVIEGFTEIGNLPMVMWTGKSGEMSRESLPAAMLKRARRSFFGLRR